MHTPELIAPGGSYTKAMVAAHNGADAIYLGVPYTSLRMRQNKVTDFDLLQKTIDDLHDLGKQAYLTMNIFPRNNDIKIFEMIVEKVSGLGADAIIFGDPGTYMTLKKYMPNQKYHLSTQTNTLNYEAVKFWYDLGVERIVLARELNLTEIKEIKKNVPDMELEIFVHGAMCIAYSGRCMMGEYFSGRDGNKGECSHVCRYKFKVSLEEEKRPGKKFDLIQDELGTHMMSSKDLCTIERLDEIIPYVDGLKLEGRSKGEFYAGATTRAYRHVTDMVLKYGADWKQHVDTATKDLVYQIPHRPYREGFLFHDIRTEYPDGEGDNIPASADLTAQSANDLTLKSAGPTVQKEYFGLIQPDTIDVQDGLAFLFTPKQNIAVGDTLSYFNPKTTGKLTITGFYDTKGKALDKVGCNTAACYVSTDIELQGWEVLFSDPVNY